MSLATSLRLAATAVRTAGFRYGPPSSLHIGAVSCFESSRWLLDSCSAAARPAMVAAQARFYAVARVRFAFNRLAIVVASRVACAARR